MTTQHEATRLADEMALIAQGLELSAEDRLSCQLASDQLRRIEGLAADIAHKDRVIEQRSEEADQYFRERDQLRAQVNSLKTENRQLHEMTDGQRMLMDGMRAQVEALKGEVAMLKLAEEGAAEAFGVVVQEKRDLEADVKRLHALLEGAHSTIRDMARQAAIDAARAKDKP